MDNFPAQAFVYLLAAVVMVPLANRFALGSVLGYLLAGVLIGPLTGLVGTETEALRPFAELGVVMMLFVVGLELEPAVLWRMRRQLFGLGVAQVLGSAALIAGLALWLGVGLPSAIAVGLVLALSSTAIVLQTLAERGLSTTDGGRATFSVLLMQDIAVIPLLAVLPLLAVPELKAVVEFAPHAATEAAQAPNLVAWAPIWVKVPAALAAIAAIAFGGHYLTRPLFRFISEARLREIFTATALLIVLGIVLLMSAVGLSPALGAFLAGVVLANNEYRHELESDIAPFKGLLLGLFFITVGAGINLGLLATDWLPIIAMTLGLILLKALALLVVGWAGGLRGDDLGLFALGLAQAGEFCFVLLALTVGGGVIPEALAARLQLVVALSMMATPLLFVAQGALARASARRRGAVQPPADTIDEAGSVIIAGHGRFGQIVNRLLLTNGHRTVVLDHRPDLVEGMKRFGVRTFYGDASRPDLLEAAGLRQARALVVAIDDPARAIEIVDYARRTAPGLRIIARAFDRPHVYQLHQAGADEIVRETFDSALHVGRLTMVALGESIRRAELAAETFARHDRETLRQLAQVWDPRLSVLDNQSYMDVARERTRMMYEVMESIGTERERADQNHIRMPAR